MAQNNNHLQLLNCVGRWFLEVIGNYLSIHSPGQWSISQLLTESITIVPLNAPNTVNDKVEPTHFWKGVGGILEERSRSAEPHRKRIKYLTVWKETWGSWCEHRAVAWSVPRCGEQCHLWVDDINCKKITVGSSHIQKLLLPLRFKVHCWSSNGEVYMYLVVCLEPCYISHDLNCYDAEEGQRAGLEPVTYGFIKHFYDPL